MNETSYSPKFGLRSQLYDLSTAAIVVAAISTFGANSVEAKSLFHDTARASRVRPLAPYRVARADRADIEAIAQVREYGTYDDGWKGPDSIGPTRQAVDDAETFVRIFFGDGDLAAPHVGLASDGEINFYWKQPLITIDLSIFGDGTYSYYADTDSGQSYSGDNIRVQEKLPASVIALLRKTA